MGAPAAPLSSSTLRLKSEARSPQQRDNMATDGRCGGESGRLNASNVYEARHPAVVLDVEVLACRGSETREVCDYVAPVDCGHQAPGHAKYHFQPRICRGQVFLVLPIVGLRTDHGIAV